MTVAKPLSDATADLLKAVLYSKMIPTFIMMTAAIAMKITTSMTRTCMMM